MTEEKRKIIILTGPTAVGKTQLSLELAGFVDGEIVSADSMQLYRGMDIGTAKITPEEMQGIPHHMIDVLEPDEDCNVYRFSRMAKEVMDDIYARGRIPVLVGGTGFYIQAILYDVDFKEEDDGGELRRALEEAARRDPHGLWERLRDVDPASADIIHENNIKRVIRALEFHELTGKLISEHNAAERTKESQYDFILFVLTMDRALLYERINERVDQMISDGLVDEVRALRERGLCNRSSTSMQAIGYREVSSYLDGEIDLERAVYLIKQNTRHFAKRQLTWFKRERDTVWISKDIGKYGAEADRMAFEEMKAVISSRGFIRRS